MGRSKKDAFSEPLVFIGKQRVVGMEISEMLHAESSMPGFWVLQQLPCYVPVTCKLLFG